VTEAEDDERWMRRALALAQAAATVPGASPIGCVIVRDGAVLAEGHNEVDIRHDPTAHAEVVTIRRATQRLECTELRGATLFSTLQPCNMCSMAAVWARIGRIVYGAGRADVHAMYFEDRHLDSRALIADAVRRDFPMRGGVLAEECAALLHGPGDAVPDEEQANT
jgi:tRNA(adenine34) deaminase